MGTSKANPGATAPAWRQARSRTRSWAEGGEGSAGLPGVLAAAATALGSGGALLTPAARDGVQRLGGLLAGFGSAGVGGTLSGLGLGHLIGAASLDLAAGLFDYLAGGGSDLDDAALQEALRDLFDAMHEQDLLTSDAALSPELAESLFLRFFAYYLTVRIMFNITDVLERTVPGEAAARREAELRDYVVAMLQTNLASRSVFQIDWNGVEGSRIVDDISRDALEVFGQEGPSDNS